MTMEGCKRQWNVTDDMVRQAEKGWVSHEGFKFKIKFASKRKDNTDWFAELTVYPQDGSVTTVLSKDIHYGLFILGTEKHESRRIDNQLRGRAGRQ
jgi:hypothetical protein